MSAIWPLGCCNFHNLEIVVLLYLVLTRTSTNNKVGTIRVKCLASLVFIARPLSAFLSQLVKTSAYIRHIDALSVVIVIAHADLDEVVAGVDTLLTIGNLDAGVWASANLLLAIRVHGLLVVPCIEGVSDNCAPATAAVDRCLEGSLALIILLMLCSRRSRHCLYSANSPAGQHRGPGLKHLKFPLRSTVQHTQSKPQGRLVRRVRTLGDAIFSHE